MKLADYQHKYPNIAFERRDGVLLMRLHTDEGPLRFTIGSWGVHAQLGHAFYDVGRDAANRVVILSGTGDAFCAAFDANAGGEEIKYDHDFYDRMYKEGKDLLMNLLDIEVPVIGVVNGPALIHAELVVMSDIVLASDTAVIADVTHFTAGVVPADGVHVWWPMLLGPNRGRHFLLTGERLNAQQAQDLGVVAEIHPHADVLQRAWELAEEMAKKPRLALRYTRVAFTQYLKRRMLDDLGYGLALEFTASAARRAEG